MILLNQRNIMMLRSSFYVSLKWTFYFLPNEIFIRSFGRTKISMISFLQAPQHPNQQINVMVEESVKLAREFSARKWPMLAFLDTHYPNQPEPSYPPHCIVGTDEENLVLGLIYLFSINIAEFLFLLKKFLLLFKFFSASI